MGPDTLGEWLGTPTRIRRLEPDALAVLLAYVPLLDAVWAASR